MKADLLVVGAGVVGLTAALEARRRHPGASIVVLDKEAAAGAHASGRNSGVLHAGFYYAADSFKARFCREGNLAWTAWCDERGLPIRKCGKLVVARSEADLAGLDELLRRAAVNGVPLEAISADDARRIEPRARTFVRALWSPSTSSVDAGEVMASLAEEAVRSGITFLTGTRWLAPGRTSAGPIDAGYVLNAAGLYADRIAHAHGFGAGRVILPFRGLYLYGDDDAPPLHTLVYPVPDLGMPFLGVHWTVDVHGHSKIGPTALPGMWREQYGGLSGFSASEAISAATVQACQLATDAGFRRLAREEVGKWSRSGLVARASQLLDGVDPRQFRVWGRPGIRAQLFDTRTRRLEMDFAVEGDERSLHVLNAVSPAFTCAIPFARWLIDQTALK